MLPENAPLNSNRIPDGTRYLREGHSPKVFRATQYSDANITTILADNAIKACPWNKIHDL